MGIHIGKEIERVYTNSGMKFSEFAKRINTSTRNVYSIFARPEIKTDQLLQISTVLDYDFFDLYRVKTGKSEEPEGDYLRGKNVTLIIELDGVQATLDLQIKKLRAINQTIV